MTNANTDSKQKHRENYQAENAEQYYRVSLFIPIIEDLIRSLGERFLGQEEIIKSLYTLIPVNTKTSEFKHLLPAIEKYSDDLNTNNESMLRAEFELWQMKCASFEKPIRTAVEALQKCAEDMFPNINKLLVMLAVLPVSTASSERSFSTLKRLKTYLRNRTGEDRLVGLALMSVHRNIEINIDEVVDDFAKKNRNLNF